MNQKSNALTISLNIHFEGSLELRKVLSWLVPLAIAVIRLALHFYGAS